MIKRISSKFDNLEELERYLIDYDYYLNLGRERIRRSLEHERQHYEKARQLGYRPEIGLVVYRLIFCKLIVPYIELPKTCPLRDIKLCVDAVENPSISDRLVSLLTTDISDIWRKK